MQTGSFIHEKTQYIEQARDYLQTLLNSADNQDELEIRIGSFRHNKGFNSQITQFIYHYFIQYFSNDIKSFEKKSCVYTLKRYPKGVRVIETGTATNTVSRKFRKNFVDIHNLRIRIALSKEEDDISYTPTDTDSYEEKIKRLRTTFIHTSGDYRIDISQNIPISSSSNRNLRTSYELELEFLKKPSLKYLMDVSKWLGDTYNHIIQTYQKVIYRYNDLFGSDVRNKSEIYRDTAKPINIKIHNIPYLSYYVFLPKPNGINYFLYFDNTGIFLMSETSIVYLGPPNRAYEGTVILGEAMFTGFGDFQFKDRNVFLGFDILMYRGEDIRQKYTIDRHVYLQEFETILRDYFYVLPMFYSKSDPSKAIKECFDYIEKTFHSDENDGIVMKQNFTGYEKIKSQDTYRYPIWKWKPSEHITIDLSVYTNPDSSYTLMAGGANNTNVEFKGVPLYPYNGNVTIDKSKFGNVQDGTIIEFAWVNNSMTAQRIREDKIKPNFISVAESTWEDIFSPIGKELLLKLSGYYIDNYNMPLIKVANKICLFITETDDSHVLDQLGLYLGTNEINEAFDMAYDYAKKNNIHIPGRERNRD